MIHDDGPASPACRWCGCSDVDVVLDLGRQPPADLFPRVADRALDPSWPLRMGCCTACGLAQLLEDPGVAEEPLGIEPQALVDQADAAVAAITAAGLTAAGRRVLEFDSPHGGGWQRQLGDAGCQVLTGPTPPDPASPVDPADRADLVVDVFGLMHDADQRAALRVRVDCLAAGGTLLLQFHALRSIVAQRQWNALRHGHMAYYSTRALVGMLADLGVTAYDAWTFPLYGGTVLLAASRDARPVSSALQDLLDADDRLGTAGSAGIAGLGAAATQDAAALRSWLAEQRAAGRRVIGYAAASRTVPLLVHAGVDAPLLPAVADSAPGKVGRRLPGTSIPIVAAAELNTRADDIVLLFVPDLLDEVRRAFPAVEARGARWAVSEPRPHLV